MTSPHETELAALAQEVAELRAELDTVSGHLRATSMVLMTYLEHSPDVLRLADDVEDCAEAIRYIPAPANRVEAAAATRLDAYAELLRKAKR